MNESDRHECHLFGTNTGTLPKLCTKWSRAQASSLVETSDVWVLSHSAECAPRKAPNCQDWEFEPFSASCPYNRRTSTSFRKLIKYLKASLYLLLDVG